MVFLCLPASPPDSAVTVGVFAPGVCKHHSFKHSVGKGERRNEERGQTKEREGNGRQFAQGRRGSLRRGQLRRLTCPQPFFRGREGPHRPRRSTLRSQGGFLLVLKVMKIELRRNEWRHLVHYLGWSKSWDEWVTLDRTMKLTEENVMKMNELLEKSQILEKNTKGGRGTLNKPKPSNDNKIDKEDIRHYGGRSKKRKHESGAEDKDAESAEKLVKIQFPPTLKKQLVDDWECVTQLGKLVRLPRNPNIDDILKRYLEYSVKKDNTIAEGIGEILKGLREYFDKALPAMLLYKKECQQYREVVKDNVSPSTVYGAEHLLRLFVKLPELLVYINMEEEALTRLQQRLLDFLRYLQKNQPTFFLASYDECVKESEEEQSN